VNASPERIHFLYAGLDRFCIWMGLALTGSWLFAAFSYQASIGTGTDWFSRSGAVMGLLGTATTFRLLNHLQTALAMALKEGLATIDREVELSLHPPRLYRCVSYFAYITGIFGTAIWGYGDQLLRLAVPHSGHGA
jgi:hypothetical protein